MNKKEENNENISEGNTSNSDNMNENGWSDSSQQSCSARKRCKKRSTKKEMYEVERKEIIKEILETIKINEENKTFILHDIENSLELKNKINELEERIKKYYKTGNWNFYIQRNNGDTSPIIGLLRTLLRENDIDLTKKDISLQLDGKKIRTTKYYLMM